MPLELFHSNVVIVAHQFNPSVLNHLWLVNNDILQPVDFRDGCVFTDVFARVQSREFILVATPEQIQFASTERENEQRVIVEKLGRLIRTLPHTPYHGAGLNFTWHALGDEDVVRQLSRWLFFCNDRPLHRVFDSPDARFGGYFSKDALGSRLKLDVKPGLGETVDGERRHFLQFQFNYHLDIGQDDGAGQIERFLNRWNEARDEASVIVHESLEGHFE